MQLQTAKQQKDETPREFLDRCRSLAMKTVPKRELSLLLRSSNNPALKQYYKLYCKTLVKVIKEAKRMTLGERILKSNNKSKTTWDIINELLGKQHTTHDIQKLTTDGNHFN